MKNQHLLKLLAFISLLFFISSCDEKTSIPDTKATLYNAKLVSILKEKGFVFEENVLMVDAKVRNLKNLDLSARGLSDVSGLEVFPNLETVNLAGNNFGTAFDFSKLPPSIKSVNLQNNDIYEYNGLAEVDFEKAKITIIRKFDKLELPASARFNMETLPFYSKESKETTLTMQNAKTNKAEVYTTLREIPDPYLRDYLKFLYPSIMTAEGKLDISKPMKPLEQTVNFALDMTSYDSRYNGLVDYRNIKNIEGAEYIANNPFYKGTTFYIEAIPNLNLILKYLKPVKSIVVFGFSRVDTPIIDWSNMKHLRAVAIHKNKGLKSVDLSYSKDFMQKEGGYNQDDMIMDAIILYDCPQLTTIKFPQVQPIPIAYVVLCDLPLLESFEMDKISGAAEFIFAELPKVKKMDFSSVIHTVKTIGGVLNDSKTTNIVSITEDILKIKGVTEFITRFGKANKIRPYSWKAIGSKFYSYGEPYKSRAYDYTYLYKTEKQQKIFLKQENKAPMSFTELLRHYSKQP